MDSQWHPAMDWRKFQQNLLKQLSITDSGEYGKNIEKFVQKSIRKMMPDSMPTLPSLNNLFSRPLDYEIFETHRSIFVRCRLPDNASPLQVRVFANRRKLKIAYRDKSEEIVLPSDVESSRTIARNHDGVVEIRMPKTLHNDPYHEIFIRDGGK